jgi:hypothetical protein
VSSSLPPAAAASQNTIMKTTTDEKDGATLASAEQISKEIASKLREVDSLLLKKSKLQALSLSLRNPPAGNKSEAIKVNSTILFPP